MTAETILELLRREPIEPFRVRLSSGKAYDVPHPEMAMVLRSNVIIAQPDQTSGEVPDRFTNCSLLHVASVEPLARRQKRSAARRG